MTTINSNTLAERWVEEHGDYLYSFAIGQLRNAELAEDLVQETLLAAIKNAGSFAGRSAVRTWLTSILRHKICDHLRHACRERAVRHQNRSEQSIEDLIPQSLLFLHETASGCLQPDRRLELDELRAVIERAVGTLPPRLAQVFQLYQIEEDSNEEICKKLNISENNLRVMLFRARSLLRQQLAPFAAYHGLTAADASIA